MFSLSAASRRALIGILGLVVCLLAASAKANEDPPGRVGRVSDLAGQLFLSNSATQSSWAAIGMNYPITGADDLWVDRDGRAELDFGDGFLRLAGDTNLHVNRLDNRQVDLMLASGRLILSLRHMDAGEIVEIFTGNARVSVLRPGVYRLDVNQDRSVTVLVVREGEATLERTGESTVVRRGETATVSGQDYPSLALRTGYYTDAFDGWSETRDQRFNHSASARYVSTQMIGWRDLDDHGSWHTHATYGAVWYPARVAVGWAPYRHGRWVWVSPWGWTWVDEAPWGFAPFHYGRWVHVSGRWGWVPGRYTARPVYSPALVTFIGGDGWSFSVGAPLFAWVPLGWRDPYRPYYRCSTTYIHSVNRPYVVNYTEITAKPPQPVTNFVNLRVPGAVTSVPGAAFGSGRPVRENLVSVPERALGGAPVLAAAPAVKPIAIAGAAPAVSVVPASQMLKPAAPGMVREQGGATAAGSGSANAVRPGLAPAAPLTVREGKPLTSGSGVAEIQRHTASSAPPAARAEVPAGPRELRPHAVTREAVGGSGGASGATARVREAPPRPLREERLVAPSSSAGKPVMPPEARSANGGGRGAGRVEEMRAAPPAAPRPSSGPHSAGSMTLDKPHVSKPEARVERRAETRGAPMGEPSRVIEGARLK